MTDSVRLDKWLWAARFFRTRGLAREAVLGGRVRVDGHRVKPGRAIRSGDGLTVQRGETLFEVTVRDIGGRRVSADRVSEKYEEDPASIERRERQAQERRDARAERGERPRRPDKRQRRQIVSFTRRQK
ncbi:RNA-binding S4 domain-containing protein [Elongatibacter sediminis]|uniref:S4 domain-containing protein n=1 Tax=Elongatibacter sediminis TaxID=3119006 RepID=A0AAW9RC32_9GAMM